MALWTTINIDNMALRRILKTNLQSLIDLPFFKVGKNVLNSDFNNWLIKYYLPLAPPEAWQTPETYCHTICDISLYLSHKLFHNLWPAQKLLQTSRNAIKSRVGVRGDIEVTLTLFPLQGTNWFYWFFWNFVQWKNSLIIIYKCTVVVVLCHKNNYYSLYWSYPHVFYVSLLLWRN